MEKKIIFLAILFPVTTQDMVRTSFYIIPNKIFHTFYKKDLTFSIKILYTIDETIHGRLLYKHPERISLDEDTKIQNQKNDCYIHMHLFFHFNQCCFFLHEYGQTF